MKPPPLDEGEHATIIAQPSYIPWLYGLSYSYSNNPKLNSNVFGTVYLKSLTSKPIEYSIMVSDFSPESTLKPWYYQRNVKIPKGFNPKTTQLAQTWAMSSSNTSEFIEKMRLYFLNNQFIYTLTPTPISLITELMNFCLIHKMVFVGTTLGSCIFAEKRKHSSALGIGLFRW